MKAACAHDLTAHPAGAHKRKITHLYKVVLHDIPDNSKLIEVSATALCAERLFECDLHVADVLVVPNRTQEGIGKSQHKHILHELLP